MKKIFWGLGLLFLVFSKYSFAAPNILNCVNKETNSSEILTIDLENKQMALGGRIPFKIGLLKETEIRASSNSDGVKRDLIFQRYSGDLIWLLSRTDDTVINLIEYKCSITKKIL